jgi:hypothetical protein
MIKNLLEINNFFPIYKEIFNYTMMFDQKFSFIKENIESFSSCQDFEDKTKIFITSTKISPIEKIVCFDYFINEKIFKISLQKQMLNHLIDFTKTYFNPSELYFFPAGKSILKKYLFEPGNTDIFNDEIGNIRKLVKKKLEKDVWGVEVIIYAELLKNGSLDEMKIKNN